MRELTCPKCGTIFSVDEADYASIVSQVRGTEFDAEVSRRIEELHKQQKAEQLAREAQAGQAYQQELSAKDRVIGEKESEILRLKEQLAAIGEKRELELNAAVTEKDKEIAALKATIDQDAKALEIAILKERQQAKEATQTKDAEIAELKSLAKLAESEAALREKSLSSEYEGKLQLALSEASLRENGMKEDYEARLRIANEEVQRLKDYKVRMSTKMVGETLEVHCSTIFNGEMRPMFPNAYFEKDNDASSGSKGDFIFRDYDDGTEYISIMFEMKNEMDDTTSKHKNEDFFKKLDADRTEKKCEYAVLVSMLEPESELYNSGIVDVAWKYPKMYVIRPQFFKSLIMILVNAAKNSAQYKKELLLARSQNVDVTNFENKLNDFREKFGTHYDNASTKLQNAIDQIDATIKKLEAVKKSFEQSKNYLRLANQDTEDLTIRKLTFKNPTMKAMFDEARKKGQEEGPDNQ